MDILHFEFMRNALMAGLLASLICGIIGTLVVVNRIVFISGGIAHASYGGVGLAFFLGLPVLPVTTGFTLCAALLMALVTLRARRAGRYGHRRHLGRGHGSGHHPARPHARLQRGPS